MCDVFSNDIFSKIKPPNGFSVNLVGTKLPTSQDMYFVSKWNEVFERYSTTRVFMYKALEADCDYWFNKVDDPIVQKAMEYRIKSDLYEMALINYNILVDLSWTWTYVSAEYALYNFDKDGNITNTNEICGMTPIDIAYGLLRKTENGVSTPHAEGNPFAYLKKMAPEFSEAIELIVEFWKAFSETSIRNNYNYIKHKGKPLYSEIEMLRGEKVLGIFIDHEEYPSDIKDIQKILSVETGLQELIEFDNQMLFPYLEKLKELLVKAVNPSPLAY